MNFFTPGWTAHAKQQDYVYRTPLPQIGKEGTT